MAIYLQRYPLIFDRFIQLPFFVIHVLPVLKIAECYHGMCVYVFVYFVPVRSNGSTKTQNSNMHATLKALEAEVAVDRSVVEAALAALELENAVMYSEGVVYCI